MIGLHIGTLSRSRIHDFEKDVYESSISVSPTQMKTRGLSKVKELTQISAQIAQIRLDPTSAWLPPELWSSLLFNQGLKITRW